MEGGVEGGRGDKGKEGGWEGGRKGEGKRRLRKDKEQKEGQEQG